jgi:hypothetical protein
MNISHRILHRADGFWTVQWYGYKDDIRTLTWQDRTHSRKENVFLWETKELAAAYLCGLSTRWEEPLRMHEAMALAVEESETF